MNGSVAPDLIQKRICNQFHATWILTLESLRSFQLSTILELLEGSFYGMDLLKLHSITHKLLDRMDRVEKVRHHF